MKTGFAEGYARTSLGAPPGRPRIPPLRKGLVASRVFAYHRLARKSLCAAPYPVACCASDGLQADERKQLVRLIGVPGHDSATGRVDCGPVLFFRPPCPFPLDLQELVRRRDPGPAPGFRCTGSEPHRQDDGRDEAGRSRGGGGPPRPLFLR